MGNKKDHHLYATWSAMRRRCNSKACRGYKRYGGRGIKVTDRWDDFWVFVQDMGKKPSPSHTLDRIDNNGDYTPENCRWALPIEQANNRRDNINLTVDGVTKSIMQWAHELGVDHTTLRVRLRYGWSDEDIIRKPIKRAKKHCFKGESLTVKEWSEKTGIPAATIKCRLYKGWPLERVLEK